MDMQQLYNAWLEKASDKVPSVVVTRALKYAIDNDDFAIVREVLEGHVVTDEHREMLNWGTSTWALLAWTSSEVITDTDVERLLERVDVQVWSEMLEHSGRNSHLGKILAQRLWDKYDTNVEFRMDVMYSTKTLDPDKVDWFVTQIKDDGPRSKYEVAFCRRLARADGAWAWRVAVEVNTPVAYDSVAEYSKPTKVGVEAMWKILNERGCNKRLSQRERTNLAKVATHLVEAELDGVGEMPFTRVEIYQKAQAHLRVTVPGTATYTKLKGMVPHTILSEDEYESSLQRLKDDTQPVEDEDVDVILQRSYQGSKLALLVEGHPMLTDEQVVQIIRYKSVNNARNVDTNLWEGRSVAGARSIIELCKQHTMYRRDADWAIKNALAFAKPKVQKALREDILRSSEGIRVLDDLGVINKDDIMYLRVNPERFEVSATTNGGALRKALAERLGDNVDRWVLFEELQVDYTGTYGEIFDAVEALVSN